MLPWILWDANILKMKQKWIFHVWWVLTVLGMLKLHLTAVYCDMFSCQWVVTKMPTPTICTVMLQELMEHHHTSQQQCFQQHIFPMLSDISSSGTSASNLMSEVSELSLLSIDTPDIDVSFDISIHSDGPTSITTSSDTDSLSSISDFKVEYYAIWGWCYYELWNEMTMTCIFPTLDHLYQNLLSFIFWITGEFIILSAFAANCVLIHRPLSALSATSETTLSFTTILTAVSYQYISNSVSSSFVLGIMEMPLFLKILLSGLEFQLAESKKSTDCVIVALLSCHEAIHFSDATGKEHSKSYVDKAVCPEWRMECTLLIVRYVYCFLIQILMMS